MNNYFCVLPFFASEYQTLSDIKTPCCLLPAGTNIQQLRSEMLSGKRMPACQKCWYLEDQGKTSDRQIQNQSYDCYANKDICVVEEECRNENFSEQIVKMYTSVVCNSTCVTCGPGASSAWASLKGLPAKYTIISDDIVDKLDYPNLIMLSFVGGEPLYERKNFKILDNLINANNTACFISIVTNGSTKLTDAQITTLFKFKNLNFCLSIDGVGSVFEYVRYPLKWSTLLENIELYRSIGIDLSVSYTISNLNILSYQETVDWFDQQGLMYNHNLVSDPVYFSPNSLPAESKKLIKGIELRDHQDCDDLNFKEFINQIKQQDQLKQISIKDYIPALANLIDQSI